MQDPGDKNRGLLQGPAAGHPPLKARRAQQKPAPKHGPLALSNRDMCSMAMTGGK
jgi:hypothetical protein